MQEVSVLAADREVPTGERDEELALAARSDPAAFGLLYDRHRLTVFRYLRTRTVDEDDAAELTAVTFERALTAMPRYRPTGGGFPAWLLRIARNAAIDAGRRVSAGAADTEGWWLQRCNQVASMLRWQPFTYAAFPRISTEPSPSGLASGRHRSRPRRSACFERGLHSITLVRQQ
jgi:DNA-directed RNA polymerase specialized sigma24 family protein